MGSLLTGVPMGLRLPAGLAGDAAPYVPSAPVQIGTSGQHRGVGEAGSWQALLMMFAVVLILGTAVLMFAVRQRTRLLRRRRVRRMGEAAALMAATAEGDSHHPHPALATAHHTRHTGPPSPERVT